MTCGGVEYMLPGRRATHMPGHVAAALTQSRQTAAAADDDGVDDAYSAAVISVAFDSDVSLDVSVYDDAYPLVM